MTSQNFSLSRSFLLKWLNEDLKIKISKIEDVGRGVVLCRIINILFPHKLPMAKVRTAPKFDQDFSFNLNLVKHVLDSLGIQKILPVHKMVKLRLQDNLETLQWFYKFYQKYSNKQSISVSETSACNETPDQSAEMGDNDTRECSHQAELNELNEKYTKYKNIAGAYKKEIQFYYGKLQEIENLVKNSENSLSSDILEILYRDD